MAQGGLKNVKRKKSAGAAKKKVATSKTTKKGWKKCTTRKQGKVAAAKEQANVTKSINLKTESLMASRALGNHGTIFLGDLKKAGHNELQKQNRERKRESEQKIKKRYIERAKVQLKKLEGGL